MDIAEVVRRAQEANVQLVVFMYCDNGGVIRSKSTHIANLAARMRFGIGFSTTMQAMMALDRILPIEGMTVVGEFRLVPDPGTFRVLPYDPRSATMIGDMLALDGKPYAACPRDFLKRMRARAREMGFALQASFEPEWTLATKENGVVVPIDRTVAYSTIGLTPTRALVTRSLTRWSPRAWAWTSSMRRAARASKRSPSATRSRCARQTTT
jgi:glutamine synthetase